MKEKKQPLDEMRWCDYQQHIFERDSYSGEDVPKDPIQRERLDIIKDWTGTGKDVLDVGAGWGFVDEEIRQQGNNVTILDMPNVIKKAKVLHPNLNFLIGNCFNIPTDKKFDVVICSEVIEHLLSLDLFFDEIKRVMKDDGIFLITTPNMGRMLNIKNLIKGHTQGWEYFEEPIIHCRHFTIQTFLHTLQKYGFETIDIKGSNTGAEMEDPNFTKEENEFLEKLQTKFSPYGVFSKSLICVLCKKKKG